MLKTKKYRGFTVVKILIVIIVVGFLTSFTMIALQNAHKKSRNIQRKEYMIQISAALGLYLSNDGNGRYPIQNEWAHFQNSSLSDLITSGLLMELPKDPLINYYFDYKSNGIDFKIIAQLERDKKIMENDGGNDNNKYEIFTPGFQNE